MSDTRHLDAISAIVGTKGLVTDAADMRRYEVGARYDEGRALFVVRPGTTEEVSRVVAYAVSHGVRLVPQGGNTGVVGGSTPDQSGTQVVLSVDRLSAPLEIDLTNRTVMVGAGVRLSTLNETLATHGLFLPIDLGADPMVGGMVATNTGGARFLRYGAMRRQVLGLEVVLPDRNGTILDLTTGLRKDNAHIDLKHLFVGTSGAFGVITRAVLEVQRVPRQVATALLVPRDDEAIPLLLTALEEACGEYLSAVEGISRNAMKRTFAHVERLRNPFARGEIPPYAILVELTRNWPERGHEAALPAVLETVLAELFEQDDPLLADALIGRSEELWALRHSLPEGLKAAGHVIAFDLSLKRSDLVPFRTEIVPLLNAEFPELELCDFGHIADGGMHFNLVHPGRPDAAYIERVRDKVLDVVIRGYGGSFTGEHALGRSNQSLYDRYTPELVKQLSASLRGALTEATMGNVRFAPANRALR
ncbi:FAD-binding oxidoreductase [Bosea sp. 2KB_26]|uniref:FAD-binding oxidoreductase n=1 Tax=Bosea sp. 2KB_26 TaxID=3237475 RepID=UPI003F8FCD1F